MTLCIELSADEENRVRAAQRKGIDVAELVRGLLSGLPSQASSKNGVSTGENADMQAAENDPTLALLA